MSLSLSGWGLSLSLSVFRRSLATVKISSTVATGYGNVNALVFTSKFTFLSFNVTVLPWGEIEKKTFKEKLLRQFRLLRVSFLSISMNDAVLRTVIHKRKNRTVKSIWLICHNTLCEKLAIKRFHCNVISSHGDICKVDRSPCCLPNGPPFPPAMIVTQAGGWWRCQAIQFFFLLIHSGMYSFRSLCAIWLGVTGMLSISIRISSMLACCFLNNYKDIQCRYKLIEECNLILPLDLLSSGHLLSLHRAHGTRTAAPPRHSFL